MLYLIMNFLQTAGLNATHETLLDEITQKQKNNIILPSRTDYTGHQHQLSLDEIQRRYPIPADRLLQMVSGWQQMNHLASLLCPEPADIATDQSVTCLYMKQDKARTYQYLSGIPDFLSFDENIRYKVKHLNLLFNSTKRSSQTHSSTSLQEV